jgi:tetratricopeptide (TPR) repeat protein
MTLAEAMEAVRQRPRQADAWVALGAQLVAAGEATKAKACYQRALGLVPDHAGAHAGLAALASPPDAAQPPGLPAPAAPPSCLATDSSPAGPTGSRDAHYAPAAIEIAEYLAKGGTLPYRT